MARQCARAGIRSRPRVADGMGGACAVALAPLVRASGVDGAERLRAAHLDAVRRAHTFARNTVPFERPGSERKAEARSRSDDRSRHASTANGASVVAVTWSRLPRLRGTCPAKPGAWRPLTQLRRGETASGQSRMSRECTDAPTTAHGGNRIAKLIPDVRIIPLRMCPRCAHACEADFRVNPRSAVDSASFTK